MPASLAQFSQVAMQLYEKRAFTDGSASTSNNNPAESLFFDTVPASTATVKNQTDWLGENGTAIVINRYNGTIFRGQ